MKRAKTYFIILIIVFPLILSKISINIGTAISVDNPNNSQELDYIPVGTPAPDFNITDVTTHVSYNLSDFVGKIVVVFFFTTWCPYCKYEYPYLQELYKMYTPDLMEIIFVDPDESETQSQVSSFRNNWDMDWIVGLDDNDTIANAYDVGGYPTMFILDQTQEVVHVEYGWGEDNWPGLVYSVFASLMPDDVTTPSFNSVTIYNETELSIFNPTIRVIANISEDRTLDYATLRVDTTEGLDEFSLYFTKEEGYYLVNRIIEFEPEFIYLIDEMTVSIKVGDFWSHTNTSVTSLLPITQYVDAAVPTYSDVSVGYVQTSSTIYNVTVYARIEDDLMLTRADLQLKKGTSTVRAVSFEDYNGTHMVASGTLMNSLAEPYELVARLVLEDVAGNEVIGEFTVADAPETEESSMELALVFIGFIFSVVVLREFRKRK